MRNKEEHIASKISSLYAKIHFAPASSHKWIKPPFLFYFIFFLFLKTKILCFVIFRRAVTNEPIKSVWMEMRSACLKRGRISERNSLHDCERTYTSLCKQSQNVCFPSSAERTTLVQELMHPQNSETIMSSSCR